MVIIKRLYRARAFNLNNGTLVRGFSLAQEALGHKLNAKVKATRLRRLCKMKRQARNV